MPPSLPWPIVSAFPWITCLAALTSGLRQIKNSPPLIMASCCKILLLVFRIFRILRFRACLIFWRAWKPVKKFPHLLQLLRIQMADPLDDLLSVHPFLPSASGPLQFLSAFRL